ncbi:rhodanese-like domain-containing protein [Haloferula chungangensis]|uniref:Rhodanese-like domain-containing protein n=1 Tax=Haloferula chungangensis TaxID=1048331 RepID=A0ABW2L8V2_9BACT
MSVIIERIQTEGIAELSYLIGDDSRGTAAVIDPRADVDVYIDLARKNELCISHIFETHIHADLISGARELAARSGSAKIHASIEGDADYGFDVAGVRDGDRFDFGDVILTARHTPGHTPEHLSYEAAEKGKDRPFAVFTGDSLFVNSAGRPDLLGKDADKLASQLYDTLFDYFAKLDDGVIIHPSHGAGSPCGAAIGDRLESTIGYEKRFNPYFQKTDRDEFIEHALGTAPPEPTYYKRMKKVNAEGPEVLGHLPRLRALTLEDFKQELETGKSILIDTRDALAFGGGHMEGALNIGASPMLTVWAGWLLDPDQDILLVLSKDADAETLSRYFQRSGYTRFAGYLVGGIASWEKAGLPLSFVPQMTVHEVDSCSDDVQVIDVRSPSEWESGHIPCANHLFLPEIPEKCARFDRERPALTYCASGYRASLAASLLLKQGFTDVRTMPGSWSAWQSAGLPTSL